MVGDTLQQNGKLQLKYEEVVRRLEWTYGALAEERWGKRLIQGLEVDDGSARHKFLADEIHRLRHPPPPDDSKRLDMDGDTDVSDAYDSNDMNVRSELDEDDEYVFGNGERISYEEWNRRNDERMRGAGPSRSRPKSRPATPPPWLDSPRRAPSPPQRPRPLTPPPRGHVPPAAPPAASRSKHQRDDRSYQGPAASAPAAAAIARKDQRIEPASSMDEVEVVGTTIHANYDYDAPDLNDADADHALAAAEHDQRGVGSNAANGLKALSLDEVLASLPTAKPNVALREALWNFTDGFRTPMPLGRAKPAQPKK
ncbi:hypothetical protein AURDEDRAFT_169744 [Auricularia subglabra TFB-10046 SS5]|nr:hypothetical protein AURDEDRAFT_169744 [Auricularia subglabra TFB-10046 SS5]